jgi:hypothetical protein
MKINQHIIKLICPSSSGSLLTDHCSGVFLNEIRRSVLLTLAVGVTVVLATGCAATSNGVSARLISPVPNNQQASNSEDEGSYQSARSPGFSDFFGS